MRCNACGIGCACEDKPKPMDMEAAIESVAKTLNTTVDVLRGRDRTSHKGFQRRIGYYLLYGMCGNKSEAARTMNRTHSSAVKGIQVIQRRMARQPMFAQMVRAKERELGIGEGELGGENMVEPATALSA